jgi:hypothetical protein
MKHLFMYIFLIAVGCSRQALVNAQDLYSGLFKGKIVNSGDVTITLSNNNNTVSGRYAEESNPEAEYTLTGKIVDGVLHGQIVCVSSELLRFRFTCTQSGDILQFSLDNKLWAMLIPPLSLTRASAPSSITGTGINTGPGTGNAAFDKRIVGKWTCTTSYRSGDFSNITTEVMLIDENAVMSMYEAVSRNSTSGSYLNSGQGALIGRVNILTLDSRIIGISPDGHSQAVLASYKVDGSRMQTIAPDGEKQLWVK